jgi:peptide-methionine (S)-S-oxide reductase
LEPAGPFYYAEDQHQQYLHKVPYGYCGLQGTGVSCSIPEASSAATEASGGD